MSPVPLPLASHPATPAKTKSAWTQGSFAFCVGGCFDHKYPWVLIDVNVNGGWNAYAGG